MTRRLGISSSSLACSGASPDAVNRSNKELMVAPRAADFALKGRFITPL
jgi:hypothetical protein